MKRYKDDPRLRGKRILIADFSEESREFYASLLSYGGAITIEAENGKEALSQMDAFKPDLVVMDLHMPVIDGITASRVMRNCDRWKACPILLVSSDHNRLKALESEPFPLERRLHKPHTSAELMERVIEALESSGGDPPVNH